MLLVVKTLEGPRDIVLHGGPNPFTDRGGDLLLNFETPRIPGIIEARNLKFCVHIAGGGL